MQFTSFLNASHPTAQAMLAGQPIRLIGPNDETLEGFYSVVETRTEEDKANNATASNLIFTVEAEAGTAESLLRPKPKETPNRKEK